MTKVIVGSAYLICIDINEAEGSRESFKAMLEQAEHSADVHVSFNGEEKEFTLAEFGKLLGFKSEIGRWADDVIERLQKFSVEFKEIGERLEGALQDNINRVGGLK